MRPIKKIKGAWNTHLRLSMHFFLQIRLYRAVSGIQAKKILLNEVDLEQWKVGIDEEAALLGGSRKCSLTATIRQCCDERVKLSSSLYQGIKAWSKSMVEDKGEAARRLKMLTSLYARMPKKGRRAETLKTTNLLRQLESETMKKDIGMLGMTPIIEHLERTNEEIKRLCEARADVKVQEKHARSFEIRRKNDQMMQAVFSHIEAAYMVATSSKVVEEIDELIERINRILSETKTDFKMSKKRMSRPAMALTEVEETIVTAEAV